MTTTTTAWAHLPNAAHIDRILADAAQRPEVWGAAWDAVWDAVWDAAREAAWSAAWGAALDAARNAARSAALDALLALIAWDDASLMLDTPVPALRLYAANGSHAAVLMLLAAIALGDHS